MKTTYTPPRIETVFTSPEKPLKGELIAKVEGRLWLIPATPDGWYKRRPLLGRHRLIRATWNGLLQAVLSIRGVPAAARE